ncbi:FxLYD domain-containing protein [Micromonospora sp. WMMD1219]|uniref:FxLYD domain-containing protein n=1 Tax=Micromonospora sp. WMMD1219 TaxID=3404115 RepID=UPI003BF497E0
MKGPPPPGFYPAQPPKKSSFWGSTPGILLIVFGSLGIVAVLCVGLVMIGAVSDRNAVKQIDAQITSCSTNGRVAKVGYTVRNSGNKARRVRLEIEYRDASGARLDTDTAYVGDVPAGDTVRGDESTFLNAESTTVNCKLVRVS